MRFHKDSRHIPARTAARHALRCALATTFLGAALTGTALAYDLNEQFSVSGTIAAGGQCAELTRDAGNPEDCGGAALIQPEISFHPTESMEFFVKFGFAEGNGLNPVSPFTLATWAADLEDDLLDLNGRDRDYLLTAWYQHTFDLGDGQSLALTGGIIDSTDYIDDNAYANDEFGQFMNEAFVNSVTSFLASYDFGGAAVLTLGDWTVSAVAMDIGENDDGNGFTFFGAQLARTIHTAMGDGTYRLVVTATDSEFLDPTGTDGENLVGIVFNADQQLAEGIGAFVRIGWQDDRAAVDYEFLLSGGLDVNGGFWGRPEDNIGVGLAWLDGGNGGISSSVAAEAYYRFAVLEFFALTGDVQYIADNVRGGGDVEGFVFSLRGTAEF